jgi:hypothetical protein
VKRSLSIFLLFFVALGFAGSQSLAVLTTPIEAAEEGFTGEEREEQVLRKSATRRRQTRAKAFRRLLLHFSTMIGRNSSTARDEIYSLRSFFSPHLSSGNFHLLQVFRI